MGTSLTGLTPSTTYDALIKVGDNGPITSTLKTLSDGLGNDLPMEASTTAINFTNGLQQGGVAVPTASQVNAKQDTLVSGTNIKTVNSTSLLGSGNVSVQDVLVSGTNIKTINGTSVLGSGNIVTPTTNPSGVAGAIQFSDGSAFASDATKFFWDNTNKRLGIGTNAPTAPLTVVGTTFVNSGNSNSNGLSIGDSLTAGQLYYFSGGLYFKVLGTDMLNINATGVSIGSSNQASNRLQIRGSGSTSATTSLLVQNSAGTAALTVKDNLFIEGLSSINQLNFRFGPTNQGISTRNGDFSIGLSDSTNISGGRLYSNGTGYFWIDGLTEGASKAQNYPIIFGSRASATGTSVGSYTTEENGSQSYFGFYAAQPSAQVIVNSTTRGFLPPRMTTTQKNAIATPAAGLVVYDSTTNKLCCYNGSTWNDLF